MGIGENIRQYREKAGWTQEDLARITGLGEKYISVIENNKRSPGKKAIPELVAMWNAESDQKWENISEQTKIEFAFDEGKRSAQIEIAKLVTQMSETDRPFFK